MVVVVNTSHHFLEIEYMNTFITGGMSKNRSGQMKVRGSTLSIPETVDRQTRSGDTDMLFVELPKAMERGDIAWYLLTLVEFNSVPEYKAVIEATIAKKAPKPVKAAKAAKAPKAASTKTKSGKSLPITPGTTIVRMGKKVSAPAPAEELVEA